MDAGSLLKVLYVDDNQDLADTAVDLLRLVGFDARACYSGRDALAVAAEFRPSICLLDLNMPGMDGDELVGRLRDQAADRPVLFVAVTAMSAEEYRRRTTEAGFEMHLVKPVDPHDLVRILDAMARMLTAQKPAPAAGQNGRHVGD
ncbi:MAG: response regulator [Isosphaera sp.]|nr:response regulator [Isosphaera sp.]